MRPYYELPADKEKKILSALFSKQRSRRRHAFAPRLRYESCKKPAKAWKWKSTWDGRMGNAYNDV